MKINYPIIIIALMFCLYACKKDLNTMAEPPGSITGKWKIVSDSAFTGVGFNNRPLNYAGKAGDYFDFITDGNIYTKEGAVLDTLSYLLVSDTTAIISSFGITLNGVPETCYIKTFTIHNLIIDAPDIFTPGGVFGRKVSLTR